MAARGGEQRGLESRRLPLMDSLARRAAVASSSSSEGVDDEDADNRDWVFCSGMVVCFAPSLVGGWPWSLRRLRGGVEVRRRRPKHSSRSVQHRRVYRCGRGLAKARYDSSASSLESSTHAGRGRSPILGGLIRFDAASCHDRQLGAESSVDVAIPVVGGPFSASRIIRCRQRGGKHRRTCPQQQPHAWQRRISEHGTCLSCR